MTRARPVEVSLFLFVLDEQKAGVFTDSGFFALCSDEITITNSLITLI